MIFLQWQIRGWRDLLRLRLNRKMCVPIQSFSGKVLMSFYLLHGLLLSTFPIMSVYVSLSCNQCLQRNNAFEEYELIRFLSISQLPFNILKSQHHGQQLSILWRKVLLFCNFWNISLILLIFTYSCNVKFMYYVFKIIFKIF